MELRKDLLFDNRYLLTQRMGNGATAEVWKALDTKVDNMTIALKIYNNQGKSMDTTGIADFKKELSLVYSLQHTNLLKPSAFDDCQGVPYLVMPYCENGSSSSMVGQMNNDDVLHFLHDVASGLEFLHDRNIVHQDIKPDNILVDDNVDFLITDFGISTDLKNEKDGPLGGTRAYMAPERFEGVLSSETDIWSLGATAIEMVTGNPPYGEQGGLGQVASNEDINLPNHISPETTKLIKSMLHTNPLKRPSAYQIRSRIETFQQTGSWDKNVRRNKMIYGYTTIMALLFCIGMFFWDRFQGEHIVYYKDYVESINGPIGIGKVSPSEQAHRSLTYKFIYKGSKLDSLVLVNPEGNPTGVNDTEHADSYEIAKFKYTEDGKLDNVTEYNQYQQFKHILDYDDNMKGATYRQNDEHGTPKALRHDISYVYDIWDKSFVDQEVGCITRCLLEYYDDGSKLLKSKKYVSTDNSPLTDANNIHGKEYVYDHKNRLAEYHFLDMNSQITGDKFGRAITKIEYDNNDNRVKFTYLTLDERPSHDGQNITVVINECDSYGNTLIQKFCNIENKPVKRTDLGVFGQKYEYDNYGHVISLSHIDNNGAPAYCSEGWVKEVVEYDGEGYANKITYQDKEGNPVFNSAQGCASQELGINSKGLITLIKYYDEKGSLCVNKDEAAQYTVEYDDHGNITKQYSYDQNLKMTSYTTCVYDNRDKCSETNFYDENNELIEGLATIRYEWDRIGHLLSIEYRNKNGERTVNEDGIHRIEYKYDNEKGNKISETYLDANNELYAPGTCCVKYEYDKKSNFLSTEIFYDKDGKVVKQNLFDYDDRGNKIWTCCIDAYKNIAEQHKYEFDQSNYIIKEWVYDDENPNRILCVRKYDYNEKYQKIKESYWTESGSPDMSTYGCHYASREYDELGNLCHFSLYDANGNPVVPQHGYYACEIKKEYDSYGRETKEICCDGHGNPANGTEGWCTKTTSYNAQGAITQTENKSINGEVLKLHTIGYEENSSSIAQEMFLEEFKWGNVYWVKQTIKYNQGDENNTIKTWICLDNNKNAIKGPNGWSVKETTTDKYDNELKLEYKDINGNLANDVNDQFAQGIAEYGENGNLRKLTFTSYKEGKISLNNYGWVKRILNFNDNGKLIQETVYDEHMKKI